MIEVDGLIIRNALEQIEANKDDITTIKQSLGKALPDPIPGPTGPKGDVGSVIKTGHGLPYFTPAAEEQIYWIDLDTGKWYQYNKDLGWTVTAELKGKEGKQGKQGVQGIQGKSGLGIDTLNSINIGDNGTADVIYHDGVAHIENTGSLTYNVRDSKPVNTVLDLPIKGENKIAIDASADGESLEVKIDETGASEGQVLGVVNGELAWKSLPELPSLATVATTGSYNDLIDKPTLATVATTGSYTDLTNKPDLKTVAVTGNYIDLINKPTIPSVGEGTITLKQGDTIKGYFNVNDKSDKTIELDAGGGTVDTSNLAKLNLGTVSGTSYITQAFTANNAPDVHNITTWFNDTGSRLAILAYNTNPLTTCELMIGKGYKTPNASDYDIRKFLIKAEGKFSYLYGKNSSLTDLEYDYNLPKINTTQSRITETHNLLSDKTVKTLFGNQSIYTSDGTGNIDLYKHNVKILIEDIIAGNTTIYLTITSSQSTAIDSLTDLKTYLANDTYYPCSGYINATNADTCYFIAGLEYESSNWYYISNNDSGKYQMNLLSSGTFTDTVTTV